MRFLIMIICFSLVGCSHKNENPIENALGSINPKIKTVVDNIKEHEVQIMFSKIKRNDNNISFEDYSFQVNDSNYFYPASTVKFPIALLALEKMNNDQKFNRNTIFHLEGDSIKTTFANEITKIFAVSDNQAYNRLFEYLGQDYINKKLAEKNLNAQISHRLSVDNSGNLATIPLLFYRNDSLILKTSTVNNKSVPPLNLNKTIKGKGYMLGDSLVKSPMDFSKKNFLPITTLHNLMKQFIFPELYTENQRFMLGEQDRNFVLNTMKILPQEAGYSVPEYYDSYVKFLIFGDNKESIPSHIKIYNKVGDAYGYLTDCAYIVNEKTKTEYIITATVHVNKNQIFNDNVYEYETIGFPFLAELGRQLIDFY